MPTHRHRISIAKANQPLNEAVMQVFWATHATDANLVGNRLLRVIEGVDEPTYARLSLYLQEIATVYNAATATVARTLGGNWGEFQAALRQAQEQLPQRLAESIPQLEATDYPPLQDLYDRMCSRLSGNVAQALRPKLSQR